MAKRLLMTAEKVGCRPRVLVQGRRHSLASKIIRGLSRKGSSYDMLPEEPINLTILKLDGSSFDIQVMKTATVEELKMAIQDVFSYLPRKGPGKISWPYLWARFCLCYEGHKLVADTDYINNYGIKDGDQLHFIRHISTTYVHTKRKKKSRVAPSKQQKKALSEPKMTRCNKPKPGDHFVESDLEPESSTSRPSGKKDLSKIVARSKPTFLTNVLRVLFYCTKLQKGSKNRHLPASSRGRHDRGLLWGLRKFIRLYRRRCIASRDTWKKIDL